MTNVYSPIGAGLTLLLLGTKVATTCRRTAPTGPAPAAEDRSRPSYPSTPAEFAAERAIREAEIAVVNHVATADQRRRVAAMAAERTRAGRRRWLELESSSS